MKKEKQSKKELNEKKHRRWVVIITIATFFLTAVISYISDLLLSNTSIVIAFIILVVIILIGVVADTIGVAVTSVNLEPFNAMASKRIKGAKTSVRLVKNAPRVSNFCNDVIGDICGIISGTTTVTIVIAIGKAYSIGDTAILSLILSSVVACMTVGGKALGKELAIKKGTAIIHGLSIMIASLRLLMRREE